MKKIFITLAFCFPLFVFSQDSLLTYSKILSFDSISQNTIFDRTLIWCSKSFKDSKNAINVKEREGGIISGKAYLDCNYFIQKKKKSTDSIISPYYKTYKFDWLIEVKNSKLRFSISQLYYYTVVGATAYSSSYEKKYAVTKSETPPIDYFLTSTEKLKQYWKLSKEGLVNNLDLLIESLKSEIINRKNDEW
jgi:hypothetical protein